MSSIVNWQKALSDRCFWACYLSLRLNYEDDEAMFDVLETLFDAGYSEIDAFNNRLRGFDQENGASDQIITGSSLLIPMGSGYLWQMAFNTTPGIYHYLTHPTFQEPLLAGYDDPHFHLPIFRWTEVLGLVSKLEKTWLGPFASHFLLPLFAPLAYLKPAEQSAAHETLLAAWTKTSLLPEDRNIELVRRLTCPRKIHWSYYESLGWVTDSPHSHRNPHGLWRDKPEAFQQFRQFLNICTE